MYYLNMDSLIKMEVSKNLIILDFLCVGVIGNVILITIGYVVLQVIKKGSKSYFRTLQAEVVWILNFKIQIVIMQIELLMKQNASMSYEISKTVINKMLQISHSDFLNV